MPWLACFRPATGGTAPQLSPPGTASGANAALLAACATGDVDAVSAALTAGADVNCRQRQSLDCGLHTIACCASPDAPRFYTAAHLLLHYGADVDARNCHGQTALHLAAARDQPHLVDLLLAARANPNARTSVEGRTPLHHGAEYASDTVVRALLGAGAEVDACTQSGVTPVLLAGLRSDGAPIVGLLTFWQADAKGAEVITESVRRGGALGGASSRSSRQQQHKHDSRSGRAVHHISASSPAAAASPPPALRVSVSVSAAQAKSVTKASLLAQGQHGSCAALAALEMAASRSYGAAGTI